MSDKKFAKDLNEDGNRDEYRAASVMVYDYYPFGELMPGRSLDTAGLCVTYNNYTEIPDFHYVDGGSMGSSGANPASGYGTASLTDAGSKGVSASGTGGGLSYTITGIQARSIKLSSFFGFLPGTVTITAWLGTNISSTGTQLGSTTASFTSPAATLPISVGGTVSVPASVTVVINMPSGSSRTLFAIDSINYQTLSFALITSTITHCGSPTDKYEFGFNGQMKSNEIAGVGNHNTAKFWEYSTQYARRWNLDPKPKISESRYSVMGGNPITNSDWFGDTTTAYSTSGDKIGTLNDGLKNQVHFFKIKEGKLDEAKSLMAKANTGNLKERNASAAIVRKLSVAFMDDKSAKSLKTLAQKSISINNEVGFSAEVGADRKITFRELSGPTGTSNATTFDMPGAVAKQPSGWGSGVLGLGHTHFDNYKNMARVNSSDALLDYFGTPTLYDAYTMISGNVSRGQTKIDYQNFLGRSTPLFIGTPNGLTIYSDKAILKEQQTRLHYDWFK